MEGVLRTRVGYAGGTKENPTYHGLGDHSETVQIDYDPALISYARLLAIFWDSHDGTLSTWSRQYASLIFYHNEEQRQLALASKEAEEKRLGRKIYTEIVPYTRFYLAEDYHQKYYLKSDGLFQREYGAIYPASLDFTNSTAVARVNGYVIGNGTLEKLQRELESLGLSTAGRERLQKIVGSQEKAGQTWCPAPQG